MIAPNPYPNWTQFSFEPLWISLHNASHTRKGLYVNICVQDDLCPVSPAIELDILLAAVWAVGILLSFKGWVWLIGSIKGLHLCSYRADGVLGLWLCASFLLAVMPGGFMFFNGDSLAVIHRLLYDSHIKWLRVVLCGGTEKEGIIHMYVSTSAAVMHFKQPGENTVASTDDDLELGSVRNS